MGVVALSAILVRSLQAGPVVTDSDGHSVVGHSTARVRHLCRAVTTTQGERVEAIANLREATALYLSELPLETKGHPLVTMFSIPENA